MRTDAEELELDVKEVSSVPEGLKAILVNVSTPIHPTEDESAVKKAIANMFPSIEVERRDGRLEGSGTGPSLLARIRRRLREMRIRDTARSVCSSGVSSAHVSFSLNKQSAFGRVPNFSTGGAPLGDIDVSITADDPSAVVDWLCNLDDE
jgi:predicted RNA binding protein with dsRBD fold (UPF0201 family)